jgi:3-hydroxyacyl-CoA dehydrogenase
MSGISRIAVVGTGVIGMSWAAYFLSRGLSVVATDPAVGAAERLEAFIADAWPILQQLGGTDDPWQPRLRFVATLEEAVHGAELIQENGPEDEALKRDVFARIDRAADPGAIIATSSSGLLISRIQTACEHAGRCVVGHPFNPPHLVPLVEVVGGEHTTPETIERTMAFYTAIGKRPIRVRKEVPGHIANRLQSALWREAFSLIDQGVATVEDIDIAISQGPGLRWALLGPIMLLHLSGGPAGLAHFWDHLAAPVQSWWKTLGTPSMTPEFEQRMNDGIADEAAGRSVHEIARERDRRFVRMLVALRSEES